MAVICLTPSCICRLARHYEFHASRGSDFHGPEESYVDLGKLPQLPEDLKPFLASGGLSMARGVKSPPRIAAATPAGVQAAELSGAIVALPTDSCYALSCHLGDKDALDRIRLIRQMDDRHHLTLMVRDLSEIATPCPRRQRAVPFAQL